MAPLGILGGTFDPVHCGHLRLALEVRELLALPEIRLIPASLPPHRDRPAASAGQRLAFLRAAVADCGDLAVDERELRRSGRSYTVDTLTELRAEAPRRPLCLILGVDAFAGLAGWHRWREIIGLAHLVVAARPGAPLPTDGPVAELLAERQVDDARNLSARPAGDIAVCDIPPLDISATRIRELLAGGRSPRWLLPDAVLKLIEEEGCYRHTE